MIAKVNFLVVLICFKGKTMKNSSYFEAFRKSADEYLTTMQNATHYPLHFHSAIEITYIQKGDCQSTINNTNITATANEIIFATNYYPHSYKTSKNAKRLIFFPALDINFKENIIPNELTFPPVLTDKEFNKTHILPLLKKIYNIERNDSMTPLAKTLMTNGLTALFWGELFDNYHNELVNKELQLSHFADILVYIDSNYTENITLDSLSNKFGYNKHYFSKMFNSYMNTNLNNYINNIRIKAFIIRYLNNRSANITNLAYEVGFNSKSTFYREFMRIYNCTPKEYFTKTTFF